MSDLYSLLQKNIVPVQELKDMLANNSALLKLFKDHYDIKNKLKFIQEQEVRYGANSHVKATRRLLKDLRELQLNPLPTIAASPLDDNLLLWHANLHGTKGSPFEGLIFHLVLPEFLRYSIRQYIAYTLTLGVVIQRGLSV